jgi:predicted nucleotidyltransferase
MVDDIRLQRQQQAQAILARVQEALPAVLARYPVVVAYVYGSVARGTVLPTSDVDIALVLTESLPPYERLQLELTIEGEVEEAAGIYPIDVRVINDAPLLVKGRILQEGIRVYEGDRQKRIAFEVLTRHQYWDFEPFVRPLQQAFLNRLRQIYGQP